jgi:NAD dependent epimerase/dehydratase family enzyme
MRIIRRALRMPVGLPAPRPVLEVGAWLIRTETELLLKSRWVVPDRLLQAGYAFRHPGLEGAIADILAQSRRARRGSALA